MMMEKLILLLNIKVNSIMNQAQSLVEKEVFINSNIMIIKNVDFVRFMISN
jgi:hypothetical protein